MRHSAPAISVELTPDATWRRVALALPALAALVTTLWLLEHLRVQRPASLADPALALPGMLALGCWLLIALSGWLLLRMSGRPGRRPGHALTRSAVVATEILGWDGSAWFINPGAGTEPLPIELQIKLDLGGWLLLRARPATPDSGRTTRRRGRWLALARRDHAAAWHGLRCALYSPRPPQPLPHDR